MQLIAPQEAAKRARAAIAYAGKDLDHLEVETGIKKGTLRNIISRTRPQGAKLERLYAIADACDVPRSFMDDGFAQPVNVEELNARLAKLEAASRSGVSDPGAAIEQELEEAVHSSPQRGGSSEPGGSSRRRGGQER